MLQRWHRGEKHALNHLMPLVYPRLQAMAGGLARHEVNSTMQATAIVHEVYLRLLKVRHLELTDREHFYSFAARLMRLILVDHARNRGARKRAGVRVPLHEDMKWVALDSEEVVALHQSLEEMAAVDPQKVQLLELRYFLGCTAEEVAELTNQSKATVDRHLQYARAWLFRRLKPSNSIQA
ncbi:MAG: sigma-70 family RNA polymerase sigma factor [Bryobacterales bacterium]|nr:sigma-70 family RNA polymerase sigma factor [Bryobacterales bacterium]